jgi:threonine dehydratase
MTSATPTRADIESAHSRIRPYIHRTPVHTSQSIDAEAGATLFFKCENFQKVGAFKARGAMNAVLMLPPHERSRGVATHSSGNHAQALARAARIAGIPSYIVMPRTAPQIKKQGVRTFGGEIFDCEPTLEARETTLAEVVARTGAVEIHPFNNYDVIAGQATAGWELLEDVPHLDVLVAPVGGGGLLSGALLAAHYRAPQVAVWGAEPADADDACRSLQSGKIERSQARSVADGLLTSLGDKTFPIIRQHVRGIFTVTDAEIVAAMRLIWERLKMVVEPSCATPLAAILKQRNTFAGRRVGVILTGGNVDMATACALFARFG